MTETCRGCGERGLRTFVDLGAQPLANAYLEREGLDRMEPFFPLHVRVCERCFLVQLPELASPDTIFTEYAYFSSVSDTWREHAAAFAAGAIERLGLDERSLVVEVGSNDGYLLRNLVARGIPCLGVEPAANVAREAEARGVPTRVAFFGRATAAEIVAEQGRADLVVANNVLAHVPDLHDFVAGLALLLAPGGTISIEFPHLLHLLAECQFDTIYHEHFSYFSLLALDPVLARHGLAVREIEKLTTHGGSLRVGVRHVAADAGMAESVEETRRDELGAGLDRLETYARFGERVDETRYRLLEFLIEARREGRSVAGYGAPAKASTLLNACGIRSDLLPFTADRSPYKQGRFLPGSRIPILAPERLLDMRPDVILILAWNLVDEIVSQLAPLVDAGCTFVAAHALTVVKRGSA